LHVITKKRAKKLSKNVKSNLTVSEKITFPVEEIIKSLGSKDNIKNISSTLSSVNILLEDISKVETKDLKKYGIKGVLKNANKLTLIFGNNASAVENAVRNVININDSVINNKDKVKSIKEKLVD
jgi:phosphotransferase system IIB component